jgi:2-amino-4-hydroxy-6-hydroxymethyldihydropteridine diphosphokinase
VIAEPDLSIPHPALLERDFMLLPLLDIAPQQRHPLTGQRLRASIKAIRYRQIIERLAAPCDKLEV